MGIASGLLAVFTVFVLMDTFVIARVQQVAQAADFSSVQAAQAAAVGDAQNVQDVPAESGDGAVAGSSQSVSADVQGESSPSAASQDTVEGENSAPETASGSATASGESRKGPRHGGGPGHGKPGHQPKSREGSSSGSSDSSDSSGTSSASGGAPGDGASSSRGSVSSSASAEEDAASIVAGAGTASSLGESVGSYSDDNVQIQVSKVRAYDTDIYVADVQVSSAEYLKTALAQGAFGRNLKDTTSNMAEQANAVLAINGDYYGFRDDGYVVRNGVLYRDTASAGTDALVVYADGSMGAASQDGQSAQSLVDAGAWQVLSFGPVLVEDGELSVQAGEEVGQAMNSNPRTAIGMVSPLHYVVVVSDGRTGDDAGLSLYQLAQVMLDNGATFAYNLDGGGSTTMYFQGEVLNDPSSGNRSGERSVSDIVYFG